MVIQTYKLPDGYKQIESITLKNGAYLKLNFNQNVRYQVDCDIELSQDSGFSSGWFGQYDTGTSYSTVRIASVQQSGSSSPIRKVFVEHRGGRICGQKAETSLRVVMHQWQDPIGDDGDYPRIRTSSSYGGTASIITSTSGSTNNFYIGAVPVSASSAMAFAVITSGADLTIRYFAIHSQTAQWYNAYTILVPCKYTRNAAYSEYGLYDVKNNKFYANATTSGVITGTVGYMAKRNLSFYKSSSAIAPIKALRPQVKAINFNGNAVHTLKYNGEVCWTEHGLLDFTPILGEKIMLNPDTGRRSIQAYLVNFDELAGILALDGLTFNDIEIGFACKRHGSHESGTRRTWHVSSGDFSWTHYGPPEHGNGNRGFTISWNKVFDMNHNTHTLGIDTSTTASRKGRLINFRAAVLKRFSKIRADQKGQNYRKRRSTGEIFFYSSTYIWVVFRYKRNIAASRGCLPTEHSRLSSNCYYTRDNGSGSCAADLTSVSPHLV